MAKKKDKVSDNLWKNAWKRLLKNRAAVLGMVIIALIVFSAIFAPYIAPYDPIKQNILARYKPPSAKHLLGTDELGRDILSRIIYGARYSLLIGIISISLALIFGIILGVLAGYYGGLVDLLIMRVVDIMLAFPYILLAIAIVAILGPELRNAMIAISIVNIPKFARIIRSSVLSIKESEYVQAAKALGASDLRIIIKYLLPNSMAPLIVQSTLSIASAILSAAGLSFLGLGAQPPTPEWGAMLSDARSALQLAPWVVTFPGIAIMLNVLGFNLLGDGLRDALDPKLKN
ncbi:peptide ABC transporter permease [Anoxybacter fermentans]|uniref:Peptide ABC transporter permease n=1 Tax=Anoxybacter fermentans TaxID=1323375 RepID=A0A3S9T1P0_9FIRM|nr:nickel transporter permease [Anoxybacter fermentans]AZR74471.1 peptide ABC transporter permease [Anoxybacter fermentans]